MSQSLFHFAAHEPPGSPERRQPAPAKNLRPSSSICGSRTLDDDIRELLSANAHREPEQRLGLAEFLAQQRARASRYQREQDRSECRRIDTLLSAVRRFRARPFPERKRMLKTVDAMARRKGHDPATMAGSAHALAIIIEMEGS